MTKLQLFLPWLVLLTVIACDLQPRIASIPDSVGDFISSRYPALLADPDVQPEIYNSAATDYGVYASPELYGSVTTEDYVLYSSIDDYVLLPQNSDVSVSVTQDVTDTVKNVDNAETVAEKSESDEPHDVIVVSDVNDYLFVPDYSAQSDVKEPEKTTVEYVSEPTAATSTEIVVVRGDTLYALAQKHNTTVAELAKVNDLKPPYALKVGQKLQMHVVRNAVEKQIVTTKHDADRPADSAKKTASNTAKTDSKTTSVTKSEPKANTKKQSVQTTTRVDLQNITVEPGDTLYSLSRRYAVPVNDLAVMNNLSAPFALYSGQKLKVPDLHVFANTGVETKKSEKTQVAKTAKNETLKPDKKTQANNNTQPKKSTADTSKQKEQTKIKKTAEPKTKMQEKQKISSDPNKKLPKIAARSSSKFSWPVRGKILSHFGSKSNGLFNDGINIGASHGTAVMSAENGVVAYAGNEVKGMGNLVIIQHSDGWMTVYAHMNSLSVRRGTKVSVGQKIGTVGQTGKVDKPQLHFEIRKGTKAYNPSSYLKK